MFQSSPPLNREHGGDKDKAGQSKSFDEQARESDGIHCHRALQISMSPKSAAATDQTYAGSAAAARRQEFRAIAEVC